MWQAKATWEASKVTWHPFSVAGNQLACLLRSVISGNEIAETNYQTKTDWQTQSKKRIGESTMTTENKSNGIVEDLKTIIEEDGDGDAHSPVVQFVELLNRASKTMAGFKYECKGILKAGLDEAKAYNEEKKAFDKAIVGEVCAEFMQAGLKAGHKESTIRSYLCHARQALGIAMRAKGAGNPGKADDETATATDKETKSKSQLANVGAFALRMFVTMVDNTPVASMPAKGDASKALWADIAYLCEAYSVNPSAVSERLRNVESFNAEPVNKPVETTVEPANVIPIKPAKKSKANVETAKAA